MSAVDILDLEKQDDLYTKVDDLDPGKSSLDAFLCSPTTTAHTLPTEELCTWLMEHFEM